MWDTATEPGPTGIRLSHDLPCQRCGHAAHTFLPCRDTCDCAVAHPPGQVLVA